MFGASSRAPSAEYDLVPSSEWGADKQLPFSVRVSRVLRHRRIIAALVGALLAAAVLVVYFVSYHVAHDKLPWPPTPDPPLYPEFHQAELALPQHQNRQPFANGRKYMWVADHTQWSGWGNFMQDMVFNAQLVYETGRSFVFDNYTWDRDGGDYAEWNGHKIPSRIPLSAMISAWCPEAREVNRGPTKPSSCSWTSWGYISLRTSSTMSGAQRRDGPRGYWSRWWAYIVLVFTQPMLAGPIVGGPFMDGDNTPVAVAKDYWDQICPNKTVIRADEIRKLHGDGADARRIIDTWVTYIKAIDDPCLEVERHSGSIFHIFMFGTPREILPVWPTLSRSPILQLFGWGTPAHDALAANRHLFSPAPLIAPYTTSPSCAGCADPYAPLDGLLALHLRRGDFIEHCANLGHWGAGFNAFNAFPEFLDPWVPPEGEEDARMALYMRRCLPTVAQIVDKIREVRRSGAGQGLRNVYIMSNGEREWLEELKAALRAAGGWEHIASSRDLVLTPEQKFVSQTLDMLVGERAQVLIGNGFSSMTSNIAMLRQARGMPADSTRMW